MRKRVVAVMLAAAVLLTVAACGVPSGGKPIVVGYPPPLGPAAPAGKAHVPDPSMYDNASSFITDGYLSALAGQTSSGAQDSVRNLFLSPSKKIKTDDSSASPVDVVRVIKTTPRPVGRRGDEQEVIESVQVIGSFDPSTGELTPQSASAKAKQLDYTVTTNGPLQLTHAPSTLYMSEDAFRQYYFPQTIYFWDGISSLIPDQRYVPQWWTTQQAATAIISWLLGQPGPPVLLGTAAEAPGKITNGASLNSNYVTVNNSGYLVNLTQTSMTPEQEAEFVAEVKWSLLQVPSQGGLPSNTTLPAVKLLIANQVVQPAARPDADFANAAAARQSTDEQPPTIGHNQPGSAQTVNALPPVAYAIESGRVTPFGYSTGGGVVSAISAARPGPPDPTRTLSDPKNTDVVLAALGAITVPGPAGSTEDQKVSALVRSVSGHQELWISRANEDGKAKYVRVSGLPATSFLRPQWLPNGALAVVADGHFYLIPAGADGSLPALPVTGLGAISAFSVGPDGHRIAFISGGQVSISTLSSGKQPALSQIYPLNLAPFVTDATGVAWSAVDRLLVGGSADNKSHVIEVAPDGFSFQDPPDLNSNGFYFDTTITQVESYPISPLDVNSSAVLVATAQKGVVGGRANPTPVSANLKVTPANPFFADPG